MFKNILLALLLLFGSLYAYDVRLDTYPKAKEWLQDADTNGQSAYNIGVLYQKEIKDNNKAIVWYKKACSMENEDSATSAANNLGYIYEDLDNYEEAKKYYKKAYSRGHTGGANNLGYLFEVKLKDNKTAEKWYKKAAKQGYEKSYKNLAIFNHDQGYTIKAAAWYIALIDIKYPKQKVLTYLKTKWNLTDTELKEAYKLQQTLDIPKHYTGGID